MDFSNTYIDAPLYDEDDVVWHYYDPQLPSRYGSNFMSFKQMPSLSTFCQYEARQHDFHEHRHMTHLRFLFPQGETFSQELQTYIENRQYDIGTLELYAMLPIDFHSRANEAVTVQFVDTSLLKAYLALQYDVDIAYGEDFAREKQHLLKQQFHEPAIRFVAALLDHQIIGTMTIFMTPETIELDSFVVADNYQRQGIGSTMQLFIMQKFTERTMLLIAEGEDTPREMYQRQGYQFCEARYEIILTK